MFTKLANVDYAPSTFTILEESIENQIHNFIVRHCKKIVHHGIDLYLHDEGILFYDDNCDSLNEGSNPASRHHRNMDAAIDYASFYQHKFDWYIPDFSVIEVSCTTLRALAFCPKEE